MSHWHKTNADLIGNESLRHLIIHRYSAQIIMENSERKMHKQKLILSL